MTLYLIDLFCGAGGFSTGAVKAGAKVLLAIDTWDIALKTHELNHPECDHLNYKLGGNKETVIKMISSYIPKLKKGDKLHVHASPPCQQLTCANNALSKDESLGLKMTFWTLDLLLKMAKDEMIDSWTMEQVNNPTLRSKLDSKKGDFCYKIFHMEEYNVPQTRTRLIISNKSLENVKKKKAILVNFEDKFVFIENQTCKNYTTYRNVNDFCYTILSSPHYLCNESKKRIRSFTNYEMSLIQTFPKNYKFYGNTQMDYRKQIANSVPPNFAKQIITSMTT
jgi:site-specific DNA-cytosine methylase